MHGSKQDVPVSVDAGGVLIRETQWGEMNIALETFPAGTDTEPLFKGLPDDRCQCEHWGYMLKGRVRIKYADHEEVIKAGEAYYLAPGHTTFFEEDSEVIEISPKGEYQKTLEVAAQNFAAMQNG
jgi:hypothetical protein